MKTWQKNTATALTVMSLGLGVVALVDPSRNPPITDTPPDVSVEDLDDANGRNSDRIREQGIDGVNDENRDKLTPGEHRSPDPKRPPHVHFPLPWR